MSGPMSEPETVYHLRRSINVYLYPVAKPLTPKQRSINIFYVPDSGTERSNKMKKNWKQWVKAAAVRAVKTVAQTAVATIGTSAVLGEVNWMMVGSASLLAGILSLLTSVAGLPEVSEGGDVNE